jgi:hypothetical protein
MQFNGCRAARGIKQSFLIFRGLVVHLLKILPVQIWSWNLTHRLRRSKQALGIFWGQDLFWWLQYGAPKKPCGPWVLSDWKDLQSWNLAGSFLDSIQNLEIFIQLNRSIGWTLNSIFLGQVQKLQIFLIRLLTIFHKFQENF